MHIFRIISQLFITYNPQFKVSYQYTKLRSEFGKHLILSHGETQILDSVLPTTEFDSNYRVRNPVGTGTDTNPSISESEVNTDRVTTVNMSMRHTEGGWPKDVDSTEQGDVSRFRKKAEKDAGYQNAIRYLGPVVERCMKQNNTVNMYEELFKDNINAEIRSEPPSAKGLAVLRDPSDVKRMVTSIDWHPDGNSKVAVSYSVMSFQDPRLNESCMSTSVSYSQNISYSIESYA